MDRSVLLEVETLRRANVARLREKYREVFGEQTRSRHREHLFRRIASNGSATTGEPDKFRSSSLQTPSKFR